MEIIRDLKNFKQRIFYYGKRFDEAKVALNTHHKIPELWKDYPEKVEYAELETGGNVYFVDYDMVQSEILFLAKGDQFDPKKMAASQVCLIPILVADYPQSCFKR